MLQHKCLIGFKTVCDIHLFLQLTFFLSEVRGYANRLNQGFGMLQMKKTRSRSPVNGSHPGKSQVEV